MATQTPASPVNVLFLTDGGQEAQAIADQLGAFLAGAQKTLEMAVYDIRLDGGPAATLVAAVKAAVARGVRVRLVFNADYAKPAPVPPPSEVDWDLVKQFGVPFEPIRGVPDLMHHKYVVRDGAGPQAGVWTGSTNWTTDSWTKEENFIIRVDSAEVAGAYGRDFEELWTKKLVAASGKFSAPWSSLQGPTGPIAVRPYFSPGRGEQLVHEIARKIGAAVRRVRICSPVITAGPVLGTLAEVAHKPGLDISGVYDATQMAEVKRQWSESPQAAWKLAAWDSVSTSIPFGTKFSTPWQKGSVHDFMHAKVTVADDYVFAGSYNLSHSGEENAENVLEFQSAPLADLFVGFVDSVRARYSQPRPPAAGN